MAALATWVEISRTPWLRVPFPTCQQSSTFLVWRTVLLTNCRLTIPKTRHQCTTLPTRLSGHSKRGSFQAKKYSLTTAKAEVPLLIQTRAAAPRLCPTWPVPRKESKRELSEWSRRFRTLTEISRCCTTLSIADLFKIIYDLNLS